jgi:hypothetical protein
MYTGAHAYHVHQTGGIAKKNRTTKSRPDGTIEETETTEFVAPPATPHSAVGSLYSLIKKIPDWR